MHFGPSCRRVGRRRVVIGGALLLVLSAIVPAAATTFVLMDVADLSRDADAAVVGRVLAVQSVLQIDGSIATDATVAVEQVVFGDIPHDATIAIRELGGTVADRREVVFGAPPYQRAERVFVFLRRGRDGLFHTTGMSMGKYEVSGEGRQALAHRDLGSGVTAVDPVTGARLGAIAQEEWLLTELVANARRAARRPAAVAPRRDRQPRVLPPEAVSEEFRFLGVPTRWFEPDDGLPIRYFVDSTGDAFLGPEISIGAVEDAFAAWSAVETSAIVLQSAGPTEPAAFSGCPDDNRIVFNDPFGEIQNPSNCRGVLALGGYCDAGEMRTVNGVVFKRIVTGKLTFNNGWGSCPIWTACGIAEIATHEIGHTIGLGHSEDAEATMALNAHFDGRCASLRSDDEAGVTFMYPLPPPSSTPTETATATPTTTHTPTVTYTPTASGTPTRTSRPPTATLTPTRTRTPTNTRTPTRTPTGSVSPSATPSATMTRTSTTTPTPVEGPEGEPFIALLLRALRRMLEVFLSLFD